MSILQLLIRVTIGFFVLFTLARIIGKKEISQMTFFNFVSAIAIGAIAGGFIVDANFSIRNGVIALILWSVYTIAIGFLDIKSKKIRKITTGEPVIVIKKGNIIEAALRKNRLDIDSLKSMLRQKDIFSIADVDYAIFETNGEISVMLKETKQPLIKEDMDLTNRKNNLYPLATEVVSDGNIITQNLSKLNLNKSWLEQELKQRGINSVEDVFYAEVQQDGSLYIDNKDHLLH
ncbi:DUF421 domain-containing protein [Metabacillus fastidiosus]|uniref:DUF421 domain-containing protein n=1 Tax=Metabacillus fastidiosus TaxID=1458 RepID=UPI002E1E742E|nr:DUF421 domain-containing protein [Metabacillus fastidiosus]